MTVLPRLAYESALRSLDVQERALGELRQRTAALLAVSSLTTSFLGGQAIARAQHLTGWHWLAIGAVGVTTALSLYLLGPRPALRFTYRATWLARALGGIEDDRALLSLASSLYDLHDRNSEALSPMQTCLLAVSVGVLVQLIAWTVALFATLAG